MTDGYSGFEQAIEHLLQGRRTSEFIWPAGLKVLWEPRSLPDWHDNQKVGIPMHVKNLKKCEFNC